MYDDYKYFENSELFKFHLIEILSNIQKNVKEECKKEVLIMLVEIDRNVTEKFMQFIKWNKLKGFEEAITIQSKNYWF